MPSQESFRVECPSFLRKLKRCNPIPHYKKNTPSHCMVPNVCKSPRKKPSFLGGVWYILILGGMGWLFIFEDLESQTSLLPSQTHLVPQLLWEVRVPVKWLYHVVSLEPLHMGIILHSEQTFIHHKVVSHNHPGDIILPIHLSLYPMNPFQNGGFRSDPHPAVTKKLRLSTWCMLHPPSREPPQWSTRWALKFFHSLIFVRKNGQEDMASCQGWWGYTSNACSIPGKLAQIQTIVDYIIMVIENNPKCGP